MTSLTEGRTLSGRLRPRRRRVEWGRFLVHLVLLLVGAACVVPMLLVLSISFSDERALALQGYSLLPVGFTTFAYGYILQEPAQIVQAYLVTALVTAVGTAGGLLLCSLLAYPLSRQDYKLRGPLSFYVFFTLLFSGGMVPFYILMTRYLGLKDNILALILPYMVTAWYVLILRTSFAQLPVELLDAARIDGAGEWRIFFQIVLPLSKPVLATIGLFFILRYWNDWFLALLFIDKPTLYPLQYLLYVLMANINFLASNPQTTGIPIPTQSARMAMAVLAFGPALFTFLLLQKYFVRGITIGGLKG
ncbi:MAG: carbohydrate ABC transporter permease [Caldilineaceae bacterium]|nr:carbohydrate ABC transporter permease [Caldilineaceae bacterium]